MLISITVPVYQNAGSLSQLHDRIVESISKIPNADYEIIFTDDGSNDGSLDVLKSLCVSDPKVCIVKLSKNFGQHAANNAAFQYAAGDIIINMSADLQDPPELIVEIVNKIIIGNDIVLATRAKVHESAIKKLTSKIHYRLIRLSVPSYPANGFDFWGVNRKAFNAFMSYNDVIRRNQIDLLSIGFKVAEIEYEKSERVYGKSQYNFRKRLDISLSQILATAVWPLRIASALGFLFSLIGISISLYIFVGYFFHETAVSGWTSLMLLLLITGGSIMATLGIIGEYLWRIYFETKNRPLYFIDQVLGSKALIDDE